MGIACTSVASAQISQSPGPSRELGTLACVVNWGRKQTQATEKRAQGGPGHTAGRGVLTEWLQ